MNISESGVIAAVQAARELVNKSLSYAQTQRVDWLHKPPNSDVALVKLNIHLNGGGRKIDRLRTFEAMATLLGWRSQNSVAGLPAEAAMAVYEDFKKKLGRGHAAAAWNNILETLCRPAWGIASTKDLPLAVIYGLLEWFEQADSAKAAWKALRSQPALWDDKLSALPGVERHTVVPIPSPPPTLWEDQP